jgi:NAD(P)-dependent dehydrogenase (short-subunit alcohol dehydrogenase family)
MVSAGDIGVVRSACVSASPPNGGFGGIVAENSMRTALVTGAGRGLGRAVALRLGELGYRVVVTAREKLAAVALASMMGGSALGLGLDVSDVESVAQLRKTAGHVDILVNNAGILLDHDQPLITMDPDLLTEHLAVNMVGALAVTQAFLPGMVERGWGRVVMVTSRAGTIAGLKSDSPAYSISKAALNALTILLASEVAGTGVLVNAVTPGRVRTRMLPDGPRTPEEAALGVVEVATLPDGSPSGALFRDGRLVEWSTAWHPPARVTVGSPP